MDEILNPEKSDKITSTEFLIATVESINTEGAALIFDGQSSVSQKRYKVLGTGCQPNVGDRVVVMKHSGTCVVLGSITNDGSTIYYTNELTDVATTAESFLVSSFYYSQCGKLAQFYVAGTTTATLPASQWNTLITLKTGRKPKSQVVMVIWSNNMTLLATSGNASIWGSVASGTALTFSAIYILA